MARAVPQIVRILDTRSYEREVLGSEPVVEQREPKLVDTKIDVNFYLSEKEAQYLYVALEMSLGVIGQEIKSYGTHPSVLLPGREPVSTTRDWEDAFRTSKDLTDILHDALITAVEHRIANEEEPEPEPVQETGLSELDVRLLEFYSSYPGRRDTETFLISEAKEGRTFSEDAVEQAEAHLEDEELIQWIVRSHTPEGLVLRLTDAGRAALDIAKANTVKASEFKLVKWTDFTHVMECPRRKQTGMACLCPEDAPDYTPSPRIQPEAGNALHQKLCDEGFSSTQE